MRAIVLLQSFLFWVIFASFRYTFLIFSFYALLFLLLVYEVLFALTAALILDTTSPCFDFVGVFAPLVGYVLLWRFMILGLRTPMDYDGFCTHCDYITATVRFSFYAFGDKGFGLGRRGFYR